MVLEYASITSVMRSIRARFFPALRSRYIDARKMRFVFGHSELNADQNFALETLKV